ncbi:MAG TPA: nitrate/nitrite transporter NrtS [Gemmatimonadales bacterium]|nr:nitrate/nitrite transporter NrtS [Gemmatimonadales bacterium]
MRSGLQIALSRPVVVRALRYAVIVGALLVAINHGDAILQGRITWPRLIRMALTVLVPYAVSTLSSVEATREGRTPPSGC